jgi:hypothetical protein
MNFKQRGQYENSYNHFLVENKNKYDKYNTKIMRGTNGMIKARSYYQQNANLMKENENILSLPKLFIKVSW